MGLSAVLLRTAYPLPHCSVPPMSHRESERPSAICAPSAPNANQYLYHYQAPLYIRSNFNTKTQDVLHPHEQVHPPPAGGNHQLFTSAPSRPCPVVWHHMPSHVLVREKRVGLASAVMAGPVGTCARGRDKARRRRRALMGLCSPRPRQPVQARPRTEE